MKKTNLSNPVKSLELINATVGLKLDLLIAIL